MLAGFVLLIVSPSRSTSSKNSFNLFYRHTGLDHVLFKDSQLFTFPRFPPILCHRTQGSADRGAQDNNDQKAP
jgi:hypothetical protein